MILRCVILLRGTMLAATAHGATEQPPVHLDCLTSLLPHVFVLDVETLISTLSGMLNAGTTRHTWRLRESRVQALMPAQKTRTLNMGIMPSPLPCRPWNRSMTGMARERNLEGR